MREGKQLRLIWVCRGITCLLRKKKRVRLKEDFSKRESDILQSLIIELKEDVAFIKQRVRRLNIRYGKSSVETEDDIELSKEKINDKCKGTTDDSMDVGRKQYEYKFDYVKDRAVGMLWNLIRGDIFQE